VKIRSTDEEWKAYTIYFDGVRDTRAVEADTDHQFVIRVDYPTNRYLRYYGNVHLVDNRTGEVHGVR
jgi:hypothetical protein